MADGSVWFRAAIGRQKNAEARWLLPMICRRGGIDKHDIGAIRILETTTEFEISKAVAEAFASRIRRPDKEDNIRIEPLADAPQSLAPSEKRLHPPRRDAKETDRSAPRNDRYRDGPQQNGKFHNASGPRFDKEAGSRTKQRHQDRQLQIAGASPAKPAFGNKAKKHRRG
jgi:ATP-dependent RNA helicase DeaD